MPSKNLSDLIAAASLLLAVLAILFSVWHQPIMDVLKLPTKGIPQNLTGTRDALRVAFWSKAFPLTLGGFLTLAALLPETFEIVVGLARCSPGSCRYNAVKATFVLTQVFAAGLTVYCAFLAAKLRQHSGRALTGKQ